MKFVDKVRKFMYGRYGNDELSMFLMKLYIVLFILSIFIKLDIISIIELLIFIIVIFRILSKNISARRRENSIFLKYKNKFLKPFKNIKRNLNDKEHIYKKCKHCKTLMKLPVDSKRGIKIAKCPKCKKTTKVLVLKREQIEFVKKK